MSTKNEELKAFLDGLKPGDTVDALLAELMRRRASLFSVPLGGC